jgi:hypothetical protein
MAQKISFHVSDIVFCTTHPSKFHSVILSKIFTIWPNINSESYSRILCVHYWPHYKIWYFSPLFNLISTQIVAQDEGEKNWNTMIAHYCDKKSTYGILFNLRLV